MTFTIDDEDYTFFPATMDGMPVIGVRYTRNGEGFTDWSAESWLPRNAEEAKQVLFHLGWEIVDSQADFQEVLE